MGQKIKEEKLVYTTQEVAKILHSSPNYIYELINKGKLKAIKLKSFPPNCLKAKKYRTKISRNIKLLYFLCVI